MRSQKLCRKSSFVERRECAKALLVVPRRRVAPPLRHTMRCPCMAPARLRTHPHRLLQWCGPFFRQTHPFSPFPHRRDADPLRVRLPKAPPRQVDLEPSRLESRPIHSGPLSRQWLPPRPVLSAHGRPTTTRKKGGSPAMSAPRAPVRSLGRAPLPSARRRLLRPHPRSRAAVSPSPLLRLQEPRVPPRRRRRRRNKPVARGASFAAVRLCV